MVYDSIYMKCLDESNPERQKINKWLVNAKRGEWRVTVNGYRVSFGDDENILKFSSSNGCEWYNLVNTLKKTQTTLNYTL